MIEKSKNNSEFKYNRFFSSFSESEIESNKKQVCVWNMANYEIAHSIGIEKVCGKNYSPKLLNRKKKVIKTNNEKSE